MTSLKILPHNTSDGTLQTRGQTYKKTCTGQTPETSPFGTTGTVPIKPKFWKNQ